LSHDKINPVSLVLTVLSNNHLTQGTTLASSLILFRISAFLFQVPSMKTSSSL